MKCTCHEEKFEDRKWKAAITAKDMHRYYGGKVIVIGEFDNQGKRVFRVLASSNNCHKHRTRFVLIINGILYI
ncbi:hypothetical protein [Niallia taxi]|uniref:hypothetical protein n=1 Tax=Niallia taxi TaxID=2499688 RepID=UPI002E20387D|nr:hypothetical protein [Niallia taxi]